MPSFSVTVAPERPMVFMSDNSSQVPVVISESALDMSDGGLYEMHPQPAIARVRRPSALRYDSDPRTIVASNKSIAESKVPEEEPEALAPSCPPSVSYQVSVSYPPSIIGSTERSKQQRNAAILHMVAVCWCFFLQGWNDGSTGPLLPVIQRVYRVGFTTVSLIFVLNCLGFITGALVNVWLADKVGFGKAMVIGAMIQFCTYVIQIPGPPFPVMVLAFYIAGFGMSISNAQANGFVGSLKEHRSTKLCVLHASYGVGAFASPFVATYFSGVKHWSFHYITSASLSLSNILVLIMVFRFKNQEVLLNEEGEMPNAASTAVESTFQQIWKHKTVHYLAIFALIYIGVEVTVGGWIVTFIIKERGGGPSAGYISSGFFGGITAGRLGLIWVNKKIGEHRAIFVYSVLAIALEVTIWVVPSIMENAVAVSFIGLLLGPMFPILVSHATRVLPHWLLTSSIGWITGVGMSGSAALPFLTGLLAEKYGIKALHPLMVAMMCVMVGMWALVPKGTRRVD
ncbi:MFS general substrate transporter [Mycena floridula]|nr:MFS general substrate transporter [Mycena floridula]